MKIRKLIKVGILLIAILLMLAGCYNYRDINNVTFVTSMVFDLDPIGNVVIYMDCVRPYRDNNESSDNGKRILYKGTGKTVLEALRDVNMASSYKINVTQNKAFIFTEKAVKEGIDKFLGIINNDQEFLVKPYIFAYFGDVERLLKVAASDEEYMGLFINDLVKKNKANSRAIIVNINEYMTASEIGANSALIGALELRKDVIDERIELSGGVIMRNNVMQEKIDIMDGLTFNILEDKVKTGTLEIVNPQMEEGFITFEILKNKTKTKIEYNGDRVLLTKDVNMKVTLAESQGRFIVDKQSLQIIEDTTEVRIKEYLQAFFDKYNKKNIDILGVERMLEIKYPGLVKEDILSILDVDIKVNLDVEGTSNTKNSYF
ncbi:Ger(x)C family spore germination protein [Clostridium thermobutyricum]|uniref:Spore germination protein A3 n=1 Tax=Clostridium thermobutyricum DSM 4928 TaxID=1121339 RepID=A0A1V4SYT3_9CLOT|nr:Ger(x)C family spore germination protein [Clostridium thermobutyricum]OPX50407.1 spore germination protein A3 precursor [Clostridium thermobutyricum DSM 4928]